jgi:predicted  nucleic acid-binding Zn-ribbon protein
MDTLFKHRTRKALKRIERGLLSLKEQVMAAFDDVKAQLDGINVNTNEMADEVVRIREFIAGLSEQLSNGITAEQAQALVAQASSVVASTQTLEDSLRATAAPQS